MTDDKAALGGVDDVVRHALKEFWINDVNKPSWFRDDQSEKLVRRITQALLPAQRGGGDDVERVERAITRTWLSGGIQGVTIRDLAEAAIAALPRSTEGWQCVPREPTLAMQKAYFAVIDKNLERVSTDPRFGRFDSHREAYAAMLSAAPAAGAERSGEDDEAVQWIRAALNMIDGDGMPPNWDGMRAFLKRVSK